MPRRPAKRPRRHAKNAELPPLEEGAEGVPVRRRALVVGRVSDPHQAGPEKTSLAEQVELSRAAVRDLGFRVAYVVEGVGSGAREESDVYRRTSEIVSAGAVGAVFFSQVDRAFRSLDVANRYMREWHAAGVEVFVGRERVRWDNAEGRFVWRLNVLIAERDREGIIERTQNGKAGQAKRGRWMLKHVPPGYDRAGGKLRPNEHASVVVELFEDVASRGGWAAVEGVPARTLNLGREALLGVIREPAYRGVNLYGGVEYPCHAFRIVSDELWRRANDNLEVLAGRSHARGPAAAASLALRVPPGAIIESALEQFQLRCKTCGGRVRFDGVRFIGLWPVPYLQCAEGHTMALLKEAIASDWCSPWWQCRDCGEVRQRLFRPYRHGKNGWRLTCATCGKVSPCPTFPFGRAEFFTQEAAVIAASGRAGRREGSA